MVPAAVPERSRGHAFHAAAAREALGLQHPVMARVADVPAPAFCFVVAATASVLAVLARPDAVGRPAAALLGAALVGVTCAAIAVHARLSTAVDERIPGIESVLLPVAALTALFITLAGTDAVPIMILAVAGCAAVTGAAPHLDALRAAGREGPRARILRDAAGTLVMLPAVLAGASDTLGWAPRAAAVLGLAALTTAEAIRPAGPRVVAAAALLAGALTALGTIAAVRAGSQATGATGLLLLWYGLRGVATAFTGERRDRLGALEYAAVTLGAVALLVTQAHLTAGG